MKKYLVLLSWAFSISTVFAQENDSFSTIGLFTPTRGQAGYPLNGYLVELENIAPYIGKTVRVNGQMSVLTIPQTYSDPQEDLPPLPAIVTYLIKNPKVEVLADDITRFQKKLELALWLVKNQPTQESLVKNPPMGFAVNAAHTFEYSLTDTQGNTVRVYLHRETRQIAFVELVENADLKKDIMTYLVETKKHTWIGSEHLCDYLNDHIYTAQICPRSEHGIMIHIGLMNP